MAVLKFNNAPSDSVDWINNHGSNHASTIWYENDIVYLLYKSSIVK